MKTFLLILRVILALVLITAGCNNLSKPSNQHVVFGLLEITIAVLALYSPAKSLIKHI